MNISLIIPAYNEEKNIRSTALDYKKVFSQCKLINNFEIILVSNNCHDSTPKICKELALQKNIVTFNIPTYSGKGGAVLKGFEKSKFNIVGFTDADNSTSPKEFIKLLSEIQKPLVGAAIGSRKAKDSKITITQPRIRKILGSSFAIVRELLFNLEINDSQCGAKIFKKSAIIPIKYKITGWAFDVELLYQVKLNKYKISEVGISWKDSTNSKVSILTPISMFIDLIKIRLSFL